MKNVSEVSCLVIDHGLFLPTALALADSFKATYYWTPSEESFPHLSKAIIGDGFPKLIRVQDFWKVLPECELVVFPDVGFGGLQTKLVEDGHAVWGSRMGYLLESHRGSFLSMLEALDMEIAPHRIIKGMTNLALFLREAEDKWIKISRFRGDMETFHWRSWKEDENLLDFYAASLGPAKDWITFYVFDSIDTNLEDGVDTYCIDGEIPDLCIHAMEKKDKALLAAVTRFGNIPSIVREPTEKFAPALKSFGYRQFFSTEVRITEEKAYFIDPTLRCASPVSQLQTELFSNLAEIIWHGANGECIEPDATAQFGAQLAITLSRESGQWAAARIPDELKRYVKCGFACQIDGRVCIPPNDWMRDEFGWLVITENNGDDLIERAKELVEKLPDGLCCDVTILAGLLEEAHESRENGVPFTDKRLPKPASVL